MAKRAKKTETLASEGLQKKASAQPTPAFPSSATPISDWQLGLILLLGVILIYQPVWFAGFIWDDDQHVTANPVIVGPLGLKEIWTTSAARICPLVLTTFWVEHSLWGVTPLPYHLVNVLLQGVSAIMLWRILRLLQVPGAWLGAALWAFHPVQVESVAWITEMKNTQSGLFYLLSIFFFVRWLNAKNPGPRTTGGWNYALTLIFAALAMASKSSTVILPLVLCLCAWWREGRWEWRSLRKVGPVFLLSAITVVISMWTQNLEGANDSSSVRSGAERLITAGNVPWFYLGKLAWPHHLVFIYPRWDIDGGLWISYLPFVALLLVLLVFWLKSDSWARPWFFALAYFLAALLPVLGLVNHYFLRYSFVGDHFQYLASMGPLALAGAGLTRLAHFSTPQRPWLQLIICTGLLFILGLTSWQRTWVYANEETLWTDTLAQNPNCWMANNNKGKFLEQQGRTDEAMALLQKALAINPDSADAHSNLGSAYFLKGQADEAMAEFQKALKIDPNSADTHNSFGTTLLQTGKVNEAMTQYQKALEINPGYTGAYVNLGNALFQIGQLDQAISQYQKALQINPHYADAHNNLGIVLLRQGKFDEAIVQFQQTLQMDPHFTDTHNNLGIALAKKGRIDEAIAQFQEALRQNPHDRNAQNNLAQAQAMERQHPHHN